MKAITIKQPWASLIAAGIKDIENRDWNTRYRGPVLIHAGKSIDMAAYAFIAREHGIILPTNPPTSGIIGIANLVDVVSFSDDPWFEGAYGFILHGARSLPFVPYRGQLGLFEVPDALLPQEVLRDVREVVKVGALR